MTTQGTAESYRVFVRNWWRWQSTDRRPLPATRKLVPDLGARKTTIATKCTREEAFAICERYRATHKPGPLSRKAEFERE